MKKAVCVVVAAVMVYAIVDARGDTEASLALEKNLKASVVRQLDFRDAALRDVAAFLGQVSGEKFNIVVQGYDDAAAPSVTLALKNVPLYDALRYVCEVTDSELRIDDHAAVIVPGKGTPANTYGVKLKIAPVEGAENQFTAEFRISETEPDGNENLLCAPKLVVLSGSRGTIESLDEGKRNGLTCTVIVTPGPDSLLAETSITIKRDGKVLWSCSQETTMAK